MTKSKSEKVLIAKTIEKLTNLDLIEKNAMKDLCNKLCRHLGAFVNLIRFLGQVDAL